MYCVLIPLIFGFATAVGAATGHWIIIVQDEGPKGSYNTKSAAVAALPLGYVASTIKAGLYQYKYPTTMMWILDDRQSTVSQIALYSTPPTPGPCK